MSGYRVLKACDECEKSYKKMWLHKGRSLCWKCYKKSVNFVYGNENYLLDEKLKKDIQKETLKNYRKIYYLKKKLEKLENSDGDSQKLNKNTILSSLNSI